MERHIRLVEIIVSLLRGAGLASVLIKNQVLTLLRNGAMTEGTQIGRLVSVTVLVKLLLVLLEHALPS